MTHTCHALDCTDAIAPRLFMCRRHWRMVPRLLQKELWKQYRPGQEVDKQPSAQYLLIAKACITSVATQERNV